MSLKDPKKVHENDEFAVFKGKDGHELKIFKKGLSEKLRKELTGLPLHAADGSYVEKPEEFVPGKDYSQEPLPGDANSSKSETPKPEKKSEPVSKKIGKLVGEYGVAPVIQGVKDVGQAYGKMASGAVDIGRGVIEGAGLAPQEEPQPVEQAVTPERKAPVEEVVPSPVVAREPVSQRAQAPTPQRIPPRQISANYQKEENQEAFNFNKDLLTGVITPKTYHQLFNDGQTTLGKIGTIFGLMLGGFGSGLSKQPNVLLEMMNKEIERDLEAQKKTTENVQNMYKISLQEELNKVAMTRQQAETAGIWKDVEAKAIDNAKTRLQLSGTHYIMSKAKLLPESERLKVQGALNTLENGVATDIAQRNAIAGDRAAQRAEEQYALRAAGHLNIVPGAQNIAADNDARYVPGVGQAGIPVSGDARKELGSHQALEDAVQDLLQYSKTHTNLIKGTPAYNEGVAKALSVQQMVREGLLGTVFRESEKPLLQKFVTDNPAGAFKMLSTQPKLKAILESNRISSNALKKQYELPTKKSGGLAPPRYDPKTGKYWTKDSNGKTIEAK